MATKLHCDSCKFENYKFEPLMYLSLPIKNETTELKTLDECFLNNFKKEKFDMEQNLVCEGCKKPSTFEKQIIITKPPHILIVHLKRFGFEHGSALKLNGLVDFPLRNLDVSQYTYGGSKIIYDLFAVTCHRGNINYGHYFSMTYDMAEAKWVLFDDYKNRVIESDKVNYMVKTNEAYLLFYIRRDLQVFKRQTLRDYI